MFFDSLINFSVVLFLYYLLFVLVENYENKKIRELYTLYEKKNPIKIK